MKPEKGTMQTETHGKDGKKKGVPPPAELPQPESIDPESILKMYAAGETDLICILGPTASGKTRYAVNLARRLNSMLSDTAMMSGITPAEGTRLSPETGAEIISADSRQVYRDMDIGTGKDLSEYGEIPVHLTDIADAGTKYNIFQYQHDFEAAYRDIRERGGIPILCGGSGLYIEAVTCGYSLPDVPADHELRARLEKEDTDTLIRKLASLKPLHNSTDYDTRKRLIRALEIAIYEQSHPVDTTHFLPKDTYYIGTLVSREERNAGIDRRLDARLREGMVEEVKGLLDRGIPAEDLIYYGLEYKFVTLYLTGELEYEEMREKLAIAIHQFAKRQMTWFRGMERKGLRIHWTRASSDFEDRTKTWK